MKKVLFTICITLLCSSLFAQEKFDTEFKKGYIGLLKINNGLITNFHTSPELYVGGITLNPQFTVIEHKLRLGANAGFVYSGNKISGIFGPMLAYKIKSINLKTLAGLANIHVLLEANWGTNKQQLFGGGIAIEALQKLHIAFTAQRDYKLNSWWFQTHIGIPIFKTKEKGDDFR